MKKIEINFKLNGKDITVECDPATTLLDLIRDLGLKGTKRGCEIGECGACTVIMNGKTAASCMILAPQAEGANITTIEGLSPEGEELHPIQQAFMAKGAVQCGFCTPGMILSAKVLLDNNPSPSREEIRRAIAGNICRCTGYKQIVEAIEYAARLMENSEV